MVIQTISKNEIAFILLSDLKHILPLDNSMHKTLSHNVLGYIDTAIKRNDFIEVTGWSLSRTNATKPIRILSNTNEPTLLTNMVRPDVCQFYKLDPLVRCGWKETLPYTILPCHLQMEVEPEQWETVFTFPAQPTVSEKQFAIQQHPPAYVVADHFYENPDAVREFALSLEFNYHPDYHKGKRTDQCYRFDGLKERFEQLIGRKIINWEKYGTNGCFQYCIGGDQIVYHCDTQQYAGVLFLSPNAPVTTGTSLFRSIHTKNMKVPEKDHALVFQNGYLDPTPFERVDSVGNVYNRLILFDSLTIHAASEYFGSTKDNGRLFQLFFFDLEQNVS